MTTVLVTRPLPLGGTTGPDPLVAALRAAGLDCRHVPTVEISAADARPLVRAIHSQPAPAWLVVTSANGAEPVAAAVRLAAGLPRATRVAAVGPGTAGALRSLGISVDYQPERFVTAAIADGLDDVAGHRIVLARADAASPELPSRLRAAGAIVEEIVAYRTTEGPRSAAPALQQVMTSLPLDLVVFTSGSTVRGLVALLEDTPMLLARARQVPAACIGPITATEAARLEFATPVVADRHTLPALASAITAFVRKEPAA